VKYVFGPVPSRRLGRSLGVDPIPLKTCNWNCVYCQLGRSVPLEIERREYAPTEDILREIEDTIGRIGQNIDWVTFAGSGEPLLHSGIGRLIAGVKSMTTTPVAVLTNGSFLHLAECRAALLPADAVLPSVDAGSAGVFKKIDRPHPGISFEQHIEGLETFRREYQGRFWPEVVLVKGINDATETLEEIAVVLERLRPDVVHLNVPTRPPAESWVEPPDDEGLMRAIAIIGRSLPVVVPVDAGVELGEVDSVPDAVVAIVSRHPMREEEIRRILLRRTDGEVSAALAEAAADGRVQVVERFGARFWTAAGSRYSGGTLSGGSGRHDRS
jgi:wyosine [tRNA(Phe)-imidazoG37] synthetase (radical SAM superfamily)